MDDIVTKSPANTCAAIAQQANSLGSDMLSAYWSVVEGKQAPAVFVAQALERINTITELLDVLRTFKPEGKR